MATTFTRTAVVPIGGGKRMSWGTFTTDSTDITGELDTGLSIVENVTITPNAAAVTALFSSIDETLPKAGAMTILFTASSDGYWTAIGT